MRGTYHGWKKYENIPDNDESPSSSLPSSLSLTCKNNHYKSRYDEHDDTGNNSGIMMTVMTMVMMMTTMTTSRSLSSHTLSRPQHSKWESRAASSWAARQPQYWPWRRSRWSWLWSTLWICCGSLSGSWWFIVIIISTMTDDYLSAHKCYVTWIAMVFWRVSTAFWQGLEARQH